MTLTYLGTASVLLDFDGVRILTDPVFDDPGSSYDMGPVWAPSAWFSSRRDYPTPVPASGIGPVDAALISHDHHVDNLDFAGRAFVLSGAVDTIITNPAAARRLSPVKRDVRGLKPGETTTVAGIRITATPARHGPRFLPQVNQVTGFLLENTRIPTVWISGDTVMSRGLRQWLQQDHNIDIAIVNCGGVRFPGVPLLSRARFTFSPQEVVEVAEALNPRMLVPVHRSGWAHFEPESALREAIAAAGLEPRTRWLEPGETIRISA